MRVRARWPRHVSTYLTELAGQLHSYYAKHQVLLADDAPRTLARLALLRSIGQVLRNGLDVLGVSAPESMYENSRGRAAAAASAAPAEK